MTIRTTRSLARRAALLLVAGAQLAAAQSPQPQSTSRAQRDTATKARHDTATRVEIYAFAQADMIYDFMQNNPEWFDVNRPSRLPAFDDQFGNDHRTWVSVRQSRFGVKATIPTPGPDAKVVFEWDLFGVGVDAGQTTIRPRHMYGQWGQFGAGQTNSVFMDVDVFPNSIEYWGPNGMLFFRNVMVFWQPINRKDSTRVTLSLERPGASGDGGIFEDRIEIQNIRARFPAPDIAAEGRYGFRRGYVELAGIVRWMNWDDILVDTLDLSGGVTGWGIALSTGLRLSKRDVFRGIVVGGAGVENYFNDAPIDVGLKRNIRGGFIDRITPVTGEALGNFGMSAFIDHNWTSTLSTAIGYSRVDIDNSELQRHLAFQSGQYALVNLLWAPIKNVLIGGELLYGQRSSFSRGLRNDPLDPDDLDDFRDPVDSDDIRFQFSMKYSFSQKFGGNGNETIRAQD